MERLNGSQYLMQLHKDLSIPKDRNIIFLYLEYTKKHLLIQLYVCNTEIVV